MTTPTSGASPSPNTSPQPVPSPEVEKTAAALTDGGATTSSPTLELRQAVITAVNLAAATCSVAIGGDATSVPNVHYLSNYKPTVNDTCWVLVNGPDILALDRDGKFGAAAWAGMGSAFVGSTESRSSASYGDLATVGPTVVGTVPASGRIMVCVSADVKTPTVTGFEYAQMSFAISGSATVAAQDSNALMCATFNSQQHIHTFFLTSFGTASPSGDSVNVNGNGNTAFSTDVASYNEIMASRVVVLTGLTPGTITITAKYRTGGTASGTWQNRTVWVLPL